MKQLAGAAALVRPILRRDRVRFGAWLVAILLLVVVTAVSTRDLYPTQADLDGAAAVAEGNAAALAFNGPAVALDTMGGQIAFQLGAFGLTMAGLLAVLLTSRLTRGEEEGGRLELLRAMPIGRHAPLAASVAVVSVLLGGVGAASAAVLVAQDLPVAGSVAMGLSITVVGLFFVGLTALTAQLSENARVASGAAGAALGAAFGIRGVGDAYAPGLSWMSPIGLAQKSRPYGGEVWWPLALEAALGLALLVAAVRLANRRDFGAGLFPPRPGPAHADVGLGRPLGLALRLTRASILWWSVGTLTLAALYGSLASAIDDFVGDNATMADYFSRGGGSLVDSFLSTTLLLNALLPAGAAVQVLLRVRSEEGDGRAELVLSTATSRWRWAGSFVAVALIGSAMSLLAGGLGLGISAAASLGDPAEVARLAAASLAYLPAVWAVVGVGVLVLGLAPRWSAAVWGAWTFCLVLAFFGSLLDLPAVVTDLSPFQHVPLVPGEPFDVVPVAVTLVVAMGLTGVGAAGMRRRDIPA
jgi:ABC-2 type transport system permease protein